SARGRGRTERGCSAKKAGARAIHLDGASQHQPQRRTKETRTLSGPPRSRWQAPEDVPRSTTSPAGTRRPTEKARRRKKEGRIQRIRRAWFSSFRSKTVTRGST